MGVQQADQPDIGHVFRQIGAGGEFGAYLVMVFLVGAGEHVEVGGLESGQVVPASGGDFALRFGHRGETVDLCGATELVADLHQLDGELQSLVEGEARGRFCREEVGEVAPVKVGGGEDFDPCQQAGLLRRHVQVAVTPVQEFIRRLEFRQKDSGCRVQGLRASEGRGLRFVSVSPCPRANVPTGEFRQLFPDQSGGKGRGYDYPVGTEVDWHPRLGLRCAFDESLRHLRCKRFGPADELRSLERHLG